MTDKVFMPLVYNPPRFAVGVENEVSAKKIAEWVNTRAPMRVNILWHKVESIKGYYDWSSADAKIGHLHVDLLNLKCSPYWAIDDDDPICKLPLRKYWESFAAFAVAAIARYNPKRVSFWNEPFAKTDLYPYNLGCFNDPATYGQFVSFVYNYVSKPVVLGELGNVTDDSTITMLNNVDDNYDVLGIHRYAYCINGKLYHDCDKSLRYAESLTDRPVLLTETAVKYKNGTFEQYQQTQVDYFQWLKRTVKETYWYTIGWNGWPQPYPTDLIINGAPTRAYHLYRP